ncbi:GAF domain-containing protein [Actinoplanes sp. GCM10030250]|uniref:GAF domain-containing protein n=1 Tax=Actinoplanes sp. GCM10030250 TaxID=3273376 RepID=UPI00360E04A0
MIIDLFERLGDPSRMRILAGYDLHNADLRTSLDAVAQRSASLLDAPVALVSVLLDSSQFILGSHGTAALAWVAEARGTPAEWAMCTHTVLAGEPYCVTDGLSDPRHSGNPFLQTSGLRSYLGVPLLGEGGYVLGAHCVVDTRPRIFTDVDLAVITDGAEKSMRLLDAYRC